MTEQEKIEEYDVRLSDVDMEHLNSGQPVFKGIDGNKRLIIRTENIN